MLITWTTKLIEMGCPKSAWSDSYLWYCDHQLKLQTRNLLLPFEVLLVINKPVSSLIYSKNSWITDNDANQRPILPLLTKWVSITTPSIKPRPLWFPLLIKLLNYFLDKSYCLMLLLLQLKFHINKLFIMVFIQ
jgi:hypothetical protein